MLNDLFLVKALLSFVAGSIIVIMATVVGEKYGTKKGGIIAGLPSTSIVTLFFIGWSQSSHVASEAASITPLIGGITCIFLLMYIDLLKKGFSVALVASLLTWIGLSAAVVISGFDAFVPSLLIYIIVLGMSYTFIEKRLKISSKESIKIKYTPTTLAMRGIAAGFIMMSGVILARFGGPVIGGIFAMFPAVFISTLAISYGIHGASFSAALMKSSLLGGVSVVAYTSSVYYTYRIMGLLAGTAASLVFSVLVSFVIYETVMKMMK
ncbi:MAG: DUF3147 family protein [Candidatus Micrarchaeota archaeon]|nr:DUF3147 family protein [Candidatus Micrarchaeota archaeon]